MCWVPLDKSLAVSEAAQRAPGIGGVLELCGAGPWDINRKIPLRRAELLSPIPAPPVSGKQAPTGIPAPGAPSTRESPSGPAPEAQQFGGGT